MKALKPDLELAMIQLVQGGIFVPLPHPMSVAQFLQAELALDTAFIDANIQTIMIDGTVVDDLDATYVLPYARLALAAAMPGSLGAALRRDGVFGSLREGINAQLHKPDALVATKPCVADVRFFGHLTKILAPYVLQHGFFIASTRLPFALQAFARDVELSSLTWYTADTGCESLVWIALERSHGFMVEVNA